MSGRRLSAKQRARVVTLYAEQKLTIPVLAERFGITPGAIHAVLWKAGIQIRQAAPRAMRWPE